MSDSDPELVAIFADEAAARLDAIAAELAAGEVGPVTRREAHTLKGAATTVGLAEVGRLIAAVEQMLGTDGPDLGALGASVAGLRALLPRIASGEDVAGDVAALAAGLRPS